jgi:hypothetical protein
VSQRVIVKNYISERLAIYGLLISLSMIIGFHLLVATGIIPFQIVWGGRLENSSQMLSFEVVSISLNLLMIMIVAVHANFLKWKINRVVIRIGLWAMFVLFFINTIGNLFSLNELEKLIFTPVTLILALFSLRLALNRSKSLPETIR